MTSPSFHDGDPWMSSMEVKLTALGYTGKPRLLRTLRRGQDRHRVNGREINQDLSLSDESRCESLKILSLVGF